MVKLALLKIMFQSSNIAKKQTQVTFSNYEVNGETVRRFCSLHKAQYKTDYQIYFYFTADMPIIYKK